MNWQDYTPQEWYLAARGDPPTQNLKPYAWFTLGALEGYERDNSHETRADGDKQ